MQNSILAIHLPSSHPLALPSSSLTHPRHSSRMPPLARDDDGISMNGTRMPGSSSRPLDDDTNCWPSDSDQMDVGSRTAALPSNGNSSSGECGCMRCLVCDPAKSAIYPCLLSRASALFHSVAHNVTDYSADKGSNSSLAAVNAALAAALTTR